MDREEATKILSNRDMHGMPCGYTNGYTEALDMAIEALEMQDICAEMLESAKPVSTDGDLISRQDAIDILDDFESEIELGVSDAYQKHMRRLEMLDAVDRPTGWTPVSEALPSEGQVVLAIGDKGTWDVGKFQGTAGWTDDERMWNWKKKTVKHVEYWMPKDAIPLPYGEDGEV